MLNPDSHTDETDYARMMSYITGMWVSQIVRAVAELSLAEHLAQGRATPAQIALAESADPEAVRRLMRACVALGILHQDSAGAFTSTGLLETLHGESRSSLRNMALAMSAPGHWLPWGRFPETVREGHSQTQKALGTDLWTYLGQHPDEGRMFGAAMLDLSTPVIGDAVAVIDTAGLGIVADIGGADGAFVLTLLESSPDVAGIVFDLPHAADGARAEAARRRLADRVEIRTGDFFDTVPEADLYLLKFILHDWDDEACVQILTNCRRAMRPGARVAVVEMVIDEGGRSRAATQMDMAMLAVTDGRERTVTEFDRLASRAGLHRRELTPVRDAYHVLELVAEP